jgi:hypothetical protein
MVRSSGDEDADKDSLSSTNDAVNRDPADVTAEKSGDYPVKMEEGMSDDIRGNSSSYEMTTVPHFNASTANGAAITVETQKISPRMHTHTNDAVYHRRVNGSKGVISTGTGLSPRAQHQKTRTTEEEIEDGNCGTASSSKETSRDDGKL